MLAAFLIAEQRAAEPLLPLWLFRDRMIAVSSVVVFLLGIGMFGVILYVPLFMQGVLGISATRSGSLLTPLLVGAVVAAVASGNIIGRTGRYRTLALCGSAARDRRNVSDGGDERQYNALGSGAQHDHRRLGDRNHAADLHAGGAERRAAGAHGRGYRIHAVLPLHRRDGWRCGFRLHYAHQVS